MGEQLNLFSMSRWAEEVWKTLDAEERREIVSILAEMGRRAVMTAKPSFQAEEAKREP